MDLDLDGIEGCLSADLSFLALTLHEGLLIMKF